MQSALAPTGHISASVYRLYMPTMPLHPDHRVHMKQQPDESRSSSARRMPLPYGSSDHTYADDTAESPFMTEVVLDGPNDRNGTRARPPPAPQSSPTSWKLDRHRHHRFQGKVLVDRFGPGDRVAAPIALMKTAGPRSQQRGLRRRVCGHGWRLCSRDIRNKW